MFALEIRANRKCCSAHIDKHYFSQVDWPFRAQFRSSNWFRVFSEPIDPLTGHFADGKTLFLVFFVANDVALITEKMLCGVNVRCLVSLASGNMSSTGDTGTHTLASSLWAHGDSRSCQSRVEFAATYAHLVLGKVIIVIYIQTYSFFLFLRDK